MGAYEVGIGDYDGDQKLSLVDLGHWASKELTRCKLSIRNLLGDLIITRRLQPST